MPTIIPNADRAVVDMDKLVGYSFNSTHERGKHKARVFASALGMTAADASNLRQILLAVVTQFDAVPGEADDYGQRYRVDFPLHYGKKRRRRFAACGLFGVMRTFLG